MNEDAILRKAFKFTIWHFVIVITIILLAFAPTNWLLIWLAGSVAVYFLFKGVRKGKMLRVRCPRCRLKFKARA